MLSSEMQKEIFERSHRLLQIREKDSLSFIRIWLKGDEELKWEVTNKIMQIFEIDSIQGDDILIFNIDRAPDKGRIRQGKKLRGDTKIKVF